MEYMKQKTVMNMLFGARSTVYMHSMKYLQQLIIICKLQTGTLILKEASFSTSISGLKAWIIVDHLSENPIESHAFCVFPFPQSPLYLFIAGIVLVFNIFLSAVQFDGILCFP